MKKLFTTGIIFCLTIMAATIAKTQQNEVKLTEDNIPEIIREMTLKEKATLLVGGGFRSMLAGSLGEKGVLVPGAAGTTRAIERLGIPSVVVSDGPAGVRIEPKRKRDKERTFYATAFPTGTILASTWNTAMVEEVGKAMGNEALEYGIDVLLGPGMNIHRNPLNGRNFEYYSEDPVLTGRMAASMIRGIQSNGVGTSAKHYALNNQETMRNGNDARVDERTARELYLKGFEIAVKESSPWTIMSSYNKVNGEWSQSNKWLLTDVLRDEWGFGGIVMTDWTGKRETDRQVAAGNDLMEPGTKGQIKDIIKKVEKGILTEEEVDACVERMLRFIVKTPRFKGYVYSNAPDLDAHALTAKEAASEGIVLLKNNGLLPFDGISKVSLFGVAAYRSCAGGTGSGNVHAPYVVNLSDALESSGISLDPDLKNLYGEYLARKRKKHGKRAAMLGEGLPEEFPIPSERLGEESSDAAVFVIGRQAGEGGDRTLEDDFLLSETEKNNLRTVYDSFHSKGKKVLVVLNIGGVIETASWDGLCDALIVDWQPGEEGASALADIITGKVSPSGKLPMTFPVDYMDIPSSANFPYDYKGKGSMNAFRKYKDKGRRNVDFTRYEERLDVGYRYFSSKGKTVAYPFGFGLSYTSFSYDEISAEKGEDGFVKVCVKVTNTGDTSGKEAVQIYVNDPSPAFEKPSLELKAFAKTGTLAPGESEVLEMDIPSYILASFNPDTSKWEVPEKIRIMAGASVADIRVETSL